MRERTAMNRRKNTIRKQLTISYVFLILLSTVLLNIVQFCQIYKYTKDQQQNEIEKEFIQTKNNIQTVLSQINTIRCQAIEVVLNSNERLKYGEKGYLYSCKEIEKNFQTLRSSGTYIADISWIDTTGRISSTNEIIRKDSYYDNPCMKDLCECKENIVYTGFYDRSLYLLADDHTPVFSVGQNIYDIYCPNLKIGFLELDIYTDALKNNVSFIPSGTDSNAILTDKDNKIIFKNENISYTYIMHRIFAFHIFAKMADNFPCFFLPITQQFHIGTFLIILHVGRFLIIPGDKIIGIARLIRNIPEQKPLFLANGIIQCIKITLSNIPTRRILQCLIDRLEP